MSGAPRIAVVGGNKLEGTVTVSGGKNALLPLMCACVLTQRPVRLSNVPAQLTDSRVMAAVLRALGVGVITPDGTTMVLTAGQITSTRVSPELGATIRASVVLLGPLLAREGRAEIPLPGGCRIGARPIDFHLRGLREMGARIEVVDGGLVRAYAPRGLTGAAVNLPKVSLGATMNLLMAACLAKGTTTITNAAIDPEILNLGQLLLAMGASIQGLGSGTVVIQGRMDGSVAEIEHRVIPDRLEMATWMIACCLTKGKIFLKNVSLGDLEGVVIRHLTAVGLHIEEAADGAGLHLSSKAPVHPLNVSITTRPYPGFPTDLQAPITPLLALCPGRHTITETVFEGRFVHVPELRKFGAEIQVAGQTATIEGAPALHGCPDAMATDLRGGAALVLAALASEGQTEISEIHHIDRGYENLVEKLKDCGANIRRI